MNELDEIVWAPLTPPTPTGVRRKPHRHTWEASPALPASSDRWCARCGVVRDETKVRRGRNNRKRGTSDELVVATTLGGRKVGQLNMPWDVEIAGYLRAQCKKLVRWPSMAAVVAWLDAIPAGTELRAVTLADAPGAGKRVRRLIVLDLDEFAAWHGRREDAA